MPEKPKNHVIYADEETHTELAMMAARKKVSIKKALKELVEREKRSEKFFGKFEDVDLFIVSEDEKTLDDFLEWHRNQKATYCPKCETNLFLNEQSKKD